MTPVTELVLLGALTGGGLVLVAASFKKSPCAPADRHRLQAAGQRLQALAAKAGIAPPSEADLAVTGRAPEAQSVRTAFCVVAGALGAPLCYGLAEVTGLRLPVVTVPVASLCGAAAGALVPAVSLRRTARQARAQFRRGLSCWLELVVLAQAGGMGPEGALDAASRLGGDPTFAALHEALVAARHSGAAPWHGLARLGRQLDIPELSELAASLSLAGSEGARIRSSLAAKASSLRRTQLSEASAEANATTERLFLPSIVLMLGFLVFLMYPAAVTLGHVL